MTRSPGIATRPAARSDRTWTIIVSSAPALISRTRPCWTISGSAGSWTRPSSWRRASSAGRPTATAKAGGTTGPASGPCSWPAPASAAGRLSGRVTASAASRRTRPSGRSSSRGRSVTPSGCRARTRRSPASLLDRASHVPLPGRQIPAAGPAEGLLQPDRPVLPAHAGDRGLLARARDGRLPLLRRTRLARLAPERIHDPDGYGSGGADGHAGREDVLHLLLPL